MRKQLIELLNRLRRDTAKNISQPLEGIKLQQFTRGDEAAQNRECFAAAVTAQKRPVVPTNSNPAQRSFGPVIIYR